MTNVDILRIALRQSAIDMNCEPGDFLSGKNLVTISRPSEQARKYLELPFDCNLVYYGKGVVASVREELAEPVRRYINSYPARNCFETPNLYALNDALAGLGLRVCFMAEYFLPDVDAIRRHTCGYRMLLMDKNDFPELYKPEWSNALCTDRKHLDVLGVGAFDGEKPIGLAACSADCADMWQIGVDVLPEYRQKGIASALTSRLALEILARGKAPFYCAAWSNVASVRNAIKSGFRPAWVELTAKSAEYIDKMNSK